MSKTIIIGSLVIGILAALMVTEYGAIKPKNGRKAVHHEGYDDISPELFKVSYTCKNKRWMVTLDTIKYFCKLCPDAMCEPAIDREGSGDVISEDDSQLIVGRYAEVYFNKQPRVCLTYHEPTAKQWRPVIQGSSSLPIPRSRSSLPPAVHRVGDSKWTHYMATPPPHNIYDTCAKEFWPVFTTEQGSQLGQVCSCDQ